MADLNAYAKRIQSDTRAETIRTIFRTMNRYGITLDELNSFKEDRQLSTGEYASKRARTKLRLVRNKAVQDAAKDVVKPQSINPFRNAEQV